jgi:DNA transformation protein and related proteins
MPDRGETPFLAFVPELFEQMGPVAVRRMFGGAGIYAKGRMFALIVDDVIYLKVDDTLKERLRKAGSAGPFVWQPASGPRAGQDIAMSYWRLPDSAMDDADDATRWGKAALAVAVAAAARKNPVKRQKKPTSKS